MTTTEYDNADLYRDTRRRMTDLCRTYGGDGTGTVPCCPNWTVTQVVSHTTGVCADILAGNIGDAGTDPWTEVQVDARAGRSLDEVLAEWDDLGPRVEVALAGGNLPDQLLFDTTSHEHDLRGAFGRPGHRDDPALLAGVRFLLDGLGDAIVTAGLPTLGVEAAPFERVAGPGRPAATLTLTPFELMRSFSGRRSVGQVRSLDWGGVDPRPWLPLLELGPFTPRPEPLEE